MTRSRRLLPASCACIAALLAAPFAAAQGALTPPGAPAPSMKSLAELDASLTALSNRTANVTPVDLLPGDATAKYIISAPGTYLVRADITVATLGVSAVRITAPDVTLDLGGHVITGPGVVTTATGILESGPVNSVVVRNGAVRGWLNGIALTSFALVENVTVSEVWLKGISLNPANSIARGCRVTNAYQLGIGAGLVTGCTVSNITTNTGNISFTGIQAEVAIDCIVSSIGNAGLSYPALGITADIVTGCSVTSVNSSSTANGITANTAERISVNSVSGGTSATGANARLVRNAFVAGVSGGTATGISCDSATDCHVVSVGTTTGIAYGLQCTNGRGCNAESITSTSGTAYGIYGTTLDNCTTATVTGGTSALGLYTTNARGCVARLVAAGTGTGYGLRGASVHDCRIDDIDSTSGSAIGLELISGGIGTHNSINNVKTWGIRLSSASAAIENTVMVVGEGSGVTTGASIYAIGSDGRIQGNTVRGASGADYGIRVVGARNFVVGNNVSGTFTGASTGAGGYDTPEFNFAADNMWGAVHKIGNTATGLISDSNGPWSNFLY